eukprot:scaffold117648_cov42-Attheya_sp.AAC.1
MVTKWGVDMVTRGGELLIATRGARQRTTEDEKESKKVGAAFSLLSYRTNRATVPIFFATASYVSNLHTRNALPYLPTTGTYHVSFLPVRGDCTEATHSWMESGIRHK